MTKRKKSRNINDYKLDKIIVFDDGCSVQYTYCKKGIAKKVHIENTWIQHVHNSFTMQFPLISLDKVHHNNMPEISCGCMLGIHDEIREDFQGLVASAAGASDFTVELIAVSKGGGCCVIA